MNYRTRNIFIAVTLAVLAALLTSLYVSNYKRNVRNEEETVTVYVAARDLPTNTSGADIIAGHLVTKQDVARRSVVPGAISDPVQVANEILLQPVYAGEQLTARRFGNRTQLGVRAQLKGTLRAVVIPGTAEQLLAGTLRAGDHVDLVGDYKMGDRTGDHISRITVRDLLVLKAPQGGGSGGKITSSVDGDVSVMLAARDLQLPKVEFLTAPDRDEKWTLALRAPVKDADSPNNLETIYTALHDGVTQAELNRAGLR
jgi:Flp pilus assembly protein CpaB